MKKRLFIAAGVLVLGLGLAQEARAIASEFKLGIGENVRRQDPPSGGPFTPLTTSLANRGVNQDFITHWFHQGWKNAFPDTGVTYLSGSCNSGSEFNNLAAYQNVLSGGKRLVLVWWWHNDDPCNLALRTEAENVLRDCLVPMIKALTPGPGLGSQVYVILQPEYNRYDACNAYSDATWSTHMNTMLAQIHSIAVPGLTVLAGPSVGDWAYDRSAYQVEGSLNGSIANSDFVAFHNIYRQNSDHPNPNDTSFGTPSPDQIDHALSYARYLKKRFNKPVFYAYQSTNSSIYGNTAQSEALLDVFRRRASLEAFDVNLFGPFWLFPDGGYPGESLIDGSNVQRPAFTTWRDEANAVIANTDRTHSIAFVTPDFGDVYSGGTVSVQWISRGRPQTASTFNLDVSVNGGAFNSVATGLAGNDSSVMNYSLDVCSLAPAADIRLRLTCPATSATVTSGRFSVRKSSATSNAQHTFEAGTHNWVSDGNATVSRVGAETWFHGASDGSLKVVSNFNSSQNSYIANTSPGITIAGTPRFTALIYVPFDLNPCTIPGATVSKVIVDMQAGSYYQSPEILLQQGWNRVTHVFTGASGNVTYMKINFNNKWGYTGNPAIYVDEIRVGNDLVFSGGSCGSPTFTSTVTVASGSPTSTPTPASGSPTSTQTPQAFSPTFSPTPTTGAACSPEYSFDGGSTQGFAAGSAAVASVNATTNLPYQGSHSLQTALNLTGANNEGLLVVSGAGFPKNYTGQVLSYWLYLPAGMSDGSNPSGATLYVKTGAGWTWHESTWMNLPSTAGWVQVSLNMAAVANPNMVQEMGVKVALGGASPNWSGTVYVDSFGPPAACPSATSTATPLTASTFTPTTTPSRTATSTRTASPTLSATSTATLSPAASFTRTATASRTPTPSASATPSVTPSSTPPNSATPSPTVSSSRTATQSSTPSPSSTETVQQSPTATATVTDFAGSPTSTETGTATATQTVVQSPSSTATPSSSATETVVVSPTSSVTPSVTESSTPSSTASPVLSATNTGTATETPLGTHTSTPTPSATPSATPSITAVDSFTRTITPSATPSATAVVNSPTFTRTATPTFSRTVTPTFSETPVVLGSPTATAVPGTVLKTLPALNPQAGNPIQVAIHLSGRADEIEFKLYSRAYTVVGEETRVGPWGPGWHVVAFTLPEQANGTYFYTVRAQGAKGPQGLPKRGTLFLLR